MRLPTSVTALTAATATLVGLTAFPAAAEQASFPDPAETGASLNDIRRVSVDHGTDRLTVQTEVIDLRRNSEGGPAGLTIRIDTREARQGPEFRLTTGLYSGTDYQLMRMRKGKPVGDPLTCAHHVRLAFAADVVRFRASRDCLGEPEQVRIGVKMVDLFDGSHPVTDWLGDPGSFTPWLASG